MIRGLILYYLNIKATHGYEIQRFIQLSGLDQWAKIQSGSIYYALTKLEKEKNITVVREERTGSRVRKIYGITEQGKQTLKEEMKDALAAPIAETGSLKFITEPILSTLEPDQMRQILKEHIAKLKEKKQLWEVWSLAKAGEAGNKLTKLSFDITISALNNQIAWHQELLDNLSEYVAESNQMQTVIKMFEADSLEASKEDSETQKKIEFVEQIKKMVAKDPNAAMENLNKIIEEISKEKA